MMKKLTFIFTILMASFASRAQSYVALEHYQLGNYIVYLEDLMEMRNGDIIAPTRLFSINGQNVSDYGYCFLKLSRENASVIDTTLVIADFTNFYLMEPNPQGAGYLFVNEEFDYGSQSNFLKIRQFDENFTYLENQLTIVPFEDTLYGGTQHYLPEGNDFVMCYTKMVNDSAVLVFARYGLDGALKDKTEHETCPIKSLAEGLEPWKESPQEYVAWGTVTEHLDNGSIMPVAYLCVIDSKLQITETVRFDPMFDYPNLSLDFDAGLDFESYDNDTYLMGCGYTERQGNNQVDGIQITKRNKTSHEIVATAYFQSQNQYTSPYVIGIERNESGEILMAYGDVAGYDNLVVVKMDSELNVIWQRDFLYPEPWEYAYKMRLLSNGGIAIPLFNNMQYPSYATVLIVNDDYDGIEEQGSISIHPYVYWPNPVQNTLHLEYSPDVTPTKIELFDLQSRLVYSQSCGLGILNMENLPAGTYTMHLTLENGKVLSDKVVKE